MIQEGTRLKVADNSGAVDVECIRVLGGTRRRYAYIGNLCVVSVKKATTGGGLKKKAVVKALVVRQRFPFRRADGTWIRFDDNAVVLLNKEGEVFATRIFGPVTREIKESGFSKIVSLAPEVL